VASDKCSADLRNVHPEVKTGDPFAYASARRARRAAIIAADIASEACERCGAVADLETDDGIPLCEGCAL
jgi:hypothetical protein